MGKLITTEEMSEKTPYSVQAISNYKARYSDFPKPKQVFRRTELYDEDEFDVWFREHEKRKNDRQ